jgi:hypothetical protein
MKQKILEAGDQRVEDPVEQELSLGSRQRVDPGAFEEEVILGACDLAKALG